MVGQKKKKKLRMKILVLIERVFFFLEAATNQTSQFLHLQVFCICNPINMRWDEKAERSVETCPDAENDLFNVEPEYLDFFRKTQNFCKLESELLEKDGKRLHGNKCWNFWY